MQKRFFLTALLLFFCAALPADESDSAPQPTVERKAFVRNFTFTGSLEAVEQTVVTVPRLRRHGNPTISYLAPEGSTATPGTILVQFDVSDLETRRLELEKNMEEARSKIVQTEANLEAQRLDQLLNVATAEKEIKVANLYLGIDPLLIPAADAEQYAYNHRVATVNLEKANERLATLDKTREAELSIVRLEFEKASLDLQEIEDAIEKMTVRATSSGLVIYAQNPTRAGKVQIGDALWAGLPVVYLPDMSQVRVNAYVYDADYPRMKPGLKAEVTFDSAPNRIFPGAVTALSGSATPRDFRSTLRAFDMSVLLEETDTSFMRPGMTARVRVPVVRENVLVVPRQAVSVTPEGTVILQRAAGQSIPVRIVDASTTELVIEGDVEPGTPLTLSRLPRTSGPVEADWIPLERDDYFFHVPASGTLEALQAVLIGPPAVSREHRFKIIQLIPEGTEVKEGDLLVTFDPTEVRNRLLSEQADLGKVEEELARTEAEQELNIKNLELELEEARVRDEKAQNRLIQAKEFESNLAVREATYEAELTTARIDLLARKLAQVRRQAETRVKVLSDRRELHRQRIARYQEGLEALVVTAPADGVVIFETDWRNEKKQVGSTVYRTDKFISLPDLETLVVRGQVTEVDAGKVSLGQQVEVSLDAVPDRIFHGKVTEVGTIFRRASADRPLKVLDITVELEGLDPQIMRPGMVARLQIATARFSDVLAVPLTSVEVVDDQSYVWARNGEKAERRAITLGENNGIVAVVVEGLEEGMEIASRPLGGS